MKTTGFTTRMIAAWLVVAVSLLPSAEAYANPAGEESRGKTAGSCIGLKRAAALNSARSVIFDLEALDPNLDDMSRVSKAAELLHRVARDQPDELRGLVRAFGRDASESERQKMLERLRKLGLKDVGEDPVGIWGVIAIAAIAFLVGSGCDGQGGCGSTDCTDPEGPCGGSSSDSSGTD